MTRRRLGRLREFTRRPLPAGLRCGRRAHAPAGTALLFGLLIAKRIGIMLDGSVVKQWVDVGIEFVIPVPSVWWYLRVRA